MEFNSRSFGKRRITVLLLVVLSVLFLLLKTCKHKKIEKIESVFHKSEFSGSTVSKSKEDKLEFKRKVRRGENLASILFSENVDQSLIPAIISKTGEIYDLKKIIAGNSFLISFDVNGFRLFRYSIAKNKYVEVSKSGNGLISGRIVEIPYEIRVEFVSGTIRGSLYESLTILEEGGGELAEHLAALYEYDIDFNRDIRRGDSFTILLEKKYLKGKFLGYGRIFASEFVNRGKKTSVIRFASQKGKSSYYHPDGKAVKKMFLRCPLPFLRLTSGFGFRKRHPVTGFSAVHNGIDLGAARGTIVRSTADGRVFSTGYNRFRGKYIVVSHGNRYKTHYYHLSRIRKGIGRGKWVKQGSVIGYVGSTGRSTGPHLHYGLQRGGRYINPLRLNSPSRNPVKKCDKERFGNSVKIIFSLFEIGNTDILNDYLKQLIFNSALNLIGDSI